MALIKSRKHAQTRFNQTMSVALAAMLLPAAAQAADAPVDTKTMNEVKIVGAAENAFKAEKASSPKYTEALVNTAQTITVIKRELIEQQGAVSLTEALRNTPGVGAFFLGENGSTVTGDGIYMRGFDASSSIFVDGIRDVASISRDTFNVEQVEVLKGPAGTDNGRSTPTGSINMVTKQANLENAYSGSVTVGGGDTKRLTADLNTVLNADAGTAFRLNLFDQDSGKAGRRVVTDKRWGIAPSLAFGLNSPTRVYLNYLHIQQNNRPDGGVTTIGLPGWTPPAPIPATATTPPKDFGFMRGAAPVDPQNYYGTDLDYDKIKGDMFTVRIEHDLANGVKFQNATRIGRTKQDYLLTSFTANSANLAGVAGADPSTWTVTRGSMTSKDQLNTMLTNQSYLTAEFATGAFKHTLVGGLELTREKQDNYTYSSNGTTALPAVSIYHPDSASSPNFVRGRNGGYSFGVTDTQSVYALDTIKLGEKWVFNGSLRLDHFKTDFDGKTYTAATATAPEKLTPAKMELSDTLVNGKLSALYKPTADSSVYALLASSKMPPGSNNFALSTQANSASNPKYDPQSTLNTELGGKLDLLAQKVSLTAAIFRTVVKNEVEQDPIDSQYYATGRKRVQGIELGVTGQLARGWLVNAGYARMSTSVEKGKVATASGENVLPYTPKQSFTTWTSYELPLGLKIGGGARFVDKLSRGTDGAVGTPTSTESYWVYDAMASYTINKHVDLRLNVYNLADKAYVAAINKSGYRYTPGTPRSASLTANFIF
ncbi:catecholate siderophore receptor Fiu [Oxalobacteraceae bacterium]|nr:catecholate siderophore receptor Fiu [Oxalobacteraceae bacterium]